MLVVTTPNIEGKKIKKYCELVIRRILWSGEVILGANGSMLMVSASGTAVLIE